MIHSAMIREQSAVERTLCTLWIGDQSTMEINQPEQSLYVAHRQCKHRVNGFMVTFYLLSCTNSGAHIVFY